MTSPNRITRDDLEAKFREVAGGVDEKVESARSKMMVGGLAAVIALIAIAYLAGKRRGARRGAVIEVIRV